MFSTFSNLQIRINSPRHGWWLPCACCAEELSAGVSLVFSHSFWIYSHAQTAQCKNPQYPPAEHKCRWFRRRSGCASACTVNGQRWKHSTKTRDLWAEMLLEHLTHLHQDDTSSHQDVRDTEHWKPEIRSWCRSSGEETWRNVTAVGVLLPCHSSSCIRKCHPTQENS